MENTIFISGFPVHERHWYTGVTSENGHKDEAKKSGSDPSEEKAKQSSYCCVQLHNRKV